MNDIPQEAPAKSKRRLWRIAIPVLLLGAIAVWLFTSRIDRRFVGTWEHSKDVDASSMQTFELRGDGTGDLIPSPKDRLAIDWWYDGSNICIQPAKSMASRFIDSFQQAFGIKPVHTWGFHVVRVDDSSFEYIPLGRGQTTLEPRAESRTAFRRLT